MCDVCVCMRRCMQTSVTSVYTRSLYGHQGGSGLVCGGDGVGETPTPHIPVGAPSPDLHCIPLTQLCSPYLL